ncbi:pseudouridine synthase [Thalassotalea atypica]|uniref:pseudouridine synthase n=1 Tax=Thalassotalea atypica TaxID=2054316 RepID=UPI0025722DEC|nr:pseudouridine synthase [Thalassotalea atypica]
MAYHSNILFLTEIVPLNTTRIDKFIAAHLNISRRDVRLILAQKRVVVDSRVATNIDQRINKFSTVILDGDVILDNQPVYIMLHKPVGVVSATSDKQHKTVIDLIDCNNIEHLQSKDELHIAGRLDLNSSGLILLTNDSRWSEAIASPEGKVEKCYQVTLENKLTHEYIEAFKQGFYFGYEDITTLPAKLTIINAHFAEVKLIEGKYHQIKRMFGRFRNPVVALHRSAIGSITLDENLAAGKYRALTAEEIKLPKPHTD